MAPYGTVIGTDNFENSKIKPDRGKRLVILRHSKHRNYREDQRVFYDETFPGKRVDFASVHYLVDDSGLPQVLEEVSNKRWGDEPEPFRILRAVGEPED